MWTIAAANVAATKLSLCSLIPVISAVSLINVDRVSFASADFQFVKRASPEGAFRPGVCRPRPLSVVNARLHKEFINRIALQNLRAIFGAVKSMKYFTMLVLTGALFLGSQSVIADASGACGYYINHDGDRVPRPCGDWRHNWEPPSTATARCNDGTWSSSRHPYASGTCSHHGGVEGYR